MNNYKNDKEEKCLKIKIKWLQKRIEKISRDERSKEDLIRNTKEEIIRYAKKDSAINEEEIAKDAFEIIDKASKLADLGYDLLGLREQKAELKSAIKRISS